MTKDKRDSLRKVRNGTIGLLLSLLVFTLCLVFLPPQIQQLFARMTMGHGYKITNEYKDYVRHDFSGGASLRDEKDQLLGERYNEQFGCYEVYYSLKGIDPEFMIYIEREAGEDFLRPNGVYFNPEKVDQLLDLMNPCYADIQISAIDANKRPVDVTGVPVYHAIIVTEDLWNAWKQNFTDKTEQERARREQHQTGSGDAYLQEQLALFKTLEQSVFVIDVEELINYCRHIMLDKELTKFSSGSSLDLYTHKDCEDTLWKVVLEVGHNNDFTLSLRESDGEWVWMYEPEIQFDYALPLEEEMQRYLNTLLPSLSQKLEADSLGDPAVIAEFWEQYLPEDALLPFYEGPFGSVWDTTEKYVICQEHEAHTHKGQTACMTADRYFDTYPSVWSDLRPLPPCLTFKSVTAFYEAVVSRKFSSEELERLTDGENALHNGMVGLPAISVIKNFAFDNEKYAQDLTWYGCGDYEITSQVMKNEDGSAVKFRLCRLDGHSFPDQYGDEWQKAEETLDGIIYTTYTRTDTSENSEITYTRKATLWSFSEGEYQYRVCERILTETTPNGEETVVAKLCDIRISLDFEYYDIHLGDESQPAPDMTKELVSKFTLISFE